MYLSMPFGRFLRKKALVVGKPLAILVDSCVVCTPKKGMDFIHAF
jgi:hypothetical protein